MEGSKGWHQGAHRERRGMAPEWEMGFAMDMGFGMGIAPPPVSSTPAYLYGLPSADTLRIDDLLDFSNHHDVFTTTTTSSATTANATESYQLPPPGPSSAAATGSITFAGASSSSSDYHHGHHHHHQHQQQHFPRLPSFTDNIYIPSEEAAELEWLSNFVEDSFSDVPYPSSGNLLAPNATTIRVDPSVHCGRGARSKRSRANSTSAVAHHHHHHPTTWSSMSQKPPQSSSSPSTTSSSSSSDFPHCDNNHSGGTTSPNISNMKGRHKDDGEEGRGGGVRRCTHCASEKTPQWRTGPLGPKTLCNACGVRYKSGRLVPEYRPAASPTFILTQHSNSHRKVLELRRQKEVTHIRREPQSYSPSAGAGAGGNVAAAPFLL